ncbi:MAG: hypothetical protein MUF72_18945 [Elainella sp. Prado103]|jgi:hypothetical protein|nr:hypothetical protein [Elainella sp. Prado103]
MNGLVKSIIFAGMLTVAPVGMAAEAWVEVAVNSMGDRILVDQNSIQRDDNEVRYWEYQDKRQSRNLTTEVIGEQPVYGMMIYRTVDCVSGTSRMQRLVLFNADREVIRRVNYETAGGSQPMSGSSTASVIQYVCDLQ